MEASNFKQSLEDLMVTFSQRMDSFEGKLQNTQTSPSIDALAADYAIFKTFLLTSLKSLQDQIQCLAKEVDRQETRNRRKILLIHGIGEESKEDTSDVLMQAVVKYLKQPLSLENINRCTRMGRPGNPDKPRPILCKFRDVSMRDKIWSAKAGLKGSGITISEFLTKTRHNIFMTARQRFGIMKCWTREGHVYVLGADGTRHRISCQEDLDSISNEVQKPTATKEVPLSKEVLAPAPRSKRGASKK